MSKNHEMFLDEIDAIRMIDHAFTMWEYAWEAAIAGFVPNSDDVKCLMRIGQTDGNGLPAVKDLERMYEITDRLGVDIKAAVDLNMLNIYAKQKGKSITIQ